MANADRYYVLAPQESCIFPGTLDGITQAYKLAQKWSKGSASRVYARYGNESELLRIYNDGNVLEMEREDG